MQTVSALPVSRPVSRAARPIGRMTYLPRPDLARHISAVDWAGIAQRMADALPADHPARDEFDGAMSMCDVVDLPNGGSVTVLRNHNARGAS